MGKKLPMQELVESYAEDPKKAKLKAAAAGKPVAPEAQPPGVTSSIASTSTAEGAPSFVKTANLQAIDDKPAPSEDLSEVLYKGIISAVPTLIGAAFGNKGGAIGAAAGKEAVDKMDTIKETSLKQAQLAEKARYDRGVTAQKLANDAEALELKRTTADATVGLKKAAQGARQDNRDYNRGKDFRKDVAAFQKEFRSDEQVKESRKALALVPQIRTMINKGTGQDAQAIKFKLATLFNGARPTDRDVDAFGGAQSAQEKLTSWLLLRGRDRLSDPNAKAYMGLLATLEKGANRELKQASKLHSEQASVRFGRPAKEIEGWLKTEVLASPMEEDDDDEDERNQLMNSILGDEEG